MTGGPALLDGLDGRGPRGWADREEGSVLRRGGRLLRSGQMPGAAVAACDRGVGTALWYDSRHAQVARGLAYQLGDLEVHRRRREHAAVAMLRVESLAALHLELGGFAACALLLIDRAATVIHC